MNMEEKYRDWKQQRATIDVGADFADKVMNQIRMVEGRKRRAAFVSYRVVDWIGAHIGAQAAAIALTTAFALAERALLLRIGIG